MPFSSKGSTPSVTGFGVQSEMLGAFKRAYHGVGYSADAYPERCPVGYVFGDEVADAYLLLGRSSRRNFHERLVHFDCGGELEMWITGSP